MSTDYSKPFLTYEEQIDRLQNNYGLEIPDRDFAINLLKTISYYDLINGYKECFMSEEGRFHANISIFDLFVLKTFDKNIQNILFKYSVYVENTFKTKLAYTLAKNHGVHTEQYLNANIMKNPHNKKKLAKRDEILNAILYTSNKSSEMPTLHYRNKHNHVPPWILFKNTTFNNVIDLYSYLKLDDKLEIANDYLKSKKINDENKTELLKTTITIVRKFRNKIAHNAKVFNHTTELNRINIKWIIYFFPSNYIYNNDDKNNYGVNDLFSMINSLILLLDNNLLVLSLIEEIKALFDVGNYSYKDTINRYIYAAHLPKDINRRLDVLHKSINDLTFKDI